ncbi:MAG: hypothetical protein V1792_27060 [Pseudomonadota bacterium]
MLWDGTTHKLEERGMGMEDSQLHDLIMEKQSDGRMSCKSACDIADRAGVPRGKMGKLLDEMKIKIHSCQLGCFD